MTKPKDRLGLVGDSVGLRLLEETVGRSQVFFHLDMDKEKCDFFFKGHLPGTRTETHIGFSPEISRIHRG